MFRCQRGNTAAEEKLKILKSKAVINGKGTGRRRHQHWEGTNTKHRDGNSLLLGKGLSKDLVAKKFMGRSKERNFSETTGKNWFIWASVR